MQETRVSPYLKHLQKCPTIFTASCFTATCFGIDESLYKNQPLWVHKLYLL